MKINKITLSFRGEQEKAYQTRYFQESLRIFRIAFLLVALLYGLFGYLDAIVISQHKNFFYLIRFGIVIPFILLVFATSFTSIFPKIWQKLLFISFVISGSGIVAMIVRAPDNYAYYTGLMLVFSAGYFFIKLRFIMASLAGWIILIIFNIAVIWLADVPISLIAAYNFFFVSANFICMFAAYYIELFNRRNYFLASQLDRKKVELEESNKNLEREVWKRTRELAENEKKYRQLVEEINDVLFSVNSSGLITYMSPAIKTHSGYNSADYIGSHISRFVHTSVVSEFTQNIEKLRIGQQYNHDYRIQTKTDEEVWVRVSVKKIETEERIIEYRGLAQNISERKQAEEALRDSEERLQSVLQAQKELICRFEPDTTLTYVNNTFIKVYGQHYDNIIGLKLVDIVPPSESPGIEKRLNNLARCSQNIVTYEREVLLPSSAVRWYEWTDYVFRDDHGSVVEYQSVGSDITDRKEKERLENEVAIAQNTLQFKQNFLANMSHEIRTPLTGVMGIIDILNQTQLSSDQQEYITILKQSSENLREIINQVLDYSKIEAGKVQLKKRVFEFQNLFDNAYSLFRSICDKEITFEALVDPKLPKYILADESRITQVINNLISNAVKFTEKGKIGLRSELLSDDTDQNMIEIGIVISDTGIGISPEKQKKLFTPFSQIDEDDTRDYEGTGLGLAICKELVNLHGGDITVESASGKGSKFTFSIKAEKSSAPDPVTSQLLENRKRKLKKLRILFAEDKLVNQKVVSLMLNGMGHEITLAKDGKQALEFYKPGNFDLILMDIQMPVMDGITATQKLKEKYKNLPPIVGLSANAFEGDREKYMDKGLDEYLTKPVRKEDFDKILEKLF